MTLRNSPTHYGAVTKTFHWAIALLVFTLLAVGLYMEDLPLSAEKLQLYNLHKSFGATLLLLMLCRLGWHLFDKRPPPAGFLTVPEKFLLRALHNFFYVLLIAMPLTGWIMSSAGGRPVSVFSLVTLPDLVGPDAALAKTFRGLHGDISTVIMIAVALHVGAALKHHFINKDVVLKRMLPVLLAALLLSPLDAGAEIPDRSGPDITSGAGTAPARKWNAIQNKSSLSFHAKQMGTEFKGSFPFFAADIVFDPDNLAASKVIVDIAPSKVSTGATDRDALLAGKDWFDVTQFPAARFETQSFRKTGENAYEAEATLTIRDVTVPVIFPFQLIIVKEDSGKETATVDGAVTLNRSKFKLGLGQWADTSVVANEVPVEVHLVAILANY